jgi:aryl carrier-like protein
LSTFNSIEVVIQIGAIPILLSLLVIGLGAFLQSRSTELLFGTLVTSPTVADWDDLDEEDADG